MLWWMKRKSCQTPLKEPDSSFCVLALLCPGVWDTETHLLHTDLPNHGYALISPRDKAFFSQSSKARAGSLPDRANLSQREGGWAGPSLQIKMGHWVPGLVSNLCGTHWERSPLSRCSKSPSLLQVNRSSVRVAPESDWLIASIKTCVPYTFLEELQLLAPMCSVHAWVPESEWIAFLDVSVQRLTFVFLSFRYNHINS